MNPTLCRAFGEKNIYFPKVGIIKSIIQLRLTLFQIEKVTNLKVEKNYEKAKLELKHDYEARKFHGTSNEGVKGISENGFRLPNPSNDNMYGAGIYFATDSSKSAREIYTKGKRKIWYRIIYITYLT